MKIYKGGKSWKIKEKMEKSVWGGVKKDREILREKEWYREKIVEMVNQINNSWILNEIIRFIENITK